MSDQPEIVSAQAWKCPCGQVNGRPEVDVCSCGEWTIDGPVKKGKAKFEPEPQPEPAPEPIPEPVIEPEPEPQPEPRPSK